MVFGGSAHGTGPRSGSGSTGLASKAMTPVRRGPRSGRVPFSTKEAYRMDIDRDINEDIQKV